MTGWQCAARPFSLPLAGRVVCAPAQSGWGIERPGSPPDCCAASSPVKGEEKGSSCRAAKKIPKTYPHPCAQWYFARALSMRGPVRVPSHRGRGRRPGSCLVSAGQEAFDSFARPFERRGRNCVIAVTPGDTAWTEVPSKASGATPMSHVVADAPCCGAPTSRITPGRKVAVGFGALARICARNGFAGRFDVGRMSLCERL